MKIKILGHAYELTEVADEFNGNWGQSSPKEGWIKISSKASKDTRESTILHEVVHIIADILDAGLSQHENKVSALAVGLYSFIKDNPELVRSMMNED